MKDLTLGLLKNDKQLLLGLKKRGFGAGKWNGFGGKVEQGETIFQAAAREFMEECGVKVSGFRERGVLVFTLPSLTEELRVHVLEALDYEGSPVESEEMRPEWFDLDKIPYDSMWPDDIYWLPSFLGGKNFTGWFKFSADNKIIDYEFKIIDA